VYSEKTPDDGQRNCPKHVEFYSPKKFEKLVHLVGFLIRSLKTRIVVALLLVDIQFSCLTKNTVFHGEKFSDN